MKTKLLLTLAFVLGFSFAHQAQTADASGVPAPTSETQYKYPYVEVVVTQEKIWLMPDETPVENLPVRIIDAKNIPVVKKDFCSKTTEWSLDISDLPAGKYRLLVGDRQIVYFDVQGKKGVL